MVSKKEKQVKVKVLLPIARVHGLSLRRGDVVTVDESRAAVYFKKGTAVPHTEVDLEDAIKACRDAGIELKVDAAKQKSIANIIAKQEKAEAKKAAKAAKEDSSDGSDS